MKKRLVHERVVREAETLLNEALSRASGGRRQVRPGDLVRYYQHAKQNPDDPNSEVVLLSGIDRVTVIWPKEPRIELQLLDRRVFKDAICLMPHDSHYRVLEERLKIDNPYKAPPGSSDGSGRTERSM